MMIAADHCYPASRGRNVVVILYAQIGTRSFSDWHGLLVKQADSSRVTYILRHYVTEVSGARGRCRISRFGFGSALARGCHS